MMSDGRPGRPGRGVRRESVSQTATAVAYLDQLAASMEMAGYPCETRYLGVPALLRVAHPLVAAVEELVAAVPGPGCAGRREWWFRSPSPSGTPICECGDMAQAVWVLSRLLAAQVVALERGAGPGDPEGR